MPKVLNIRDIEGELPPNAVYVGRSTPWGNPYYLGRDGSRAEVIKMFRIIVLPGLNLASLRGKDLVCHCAPLPCHADLLLKEANK